MKTPVAAFYFVLYCCLFFLAPGKTYGTSPLTNTLQDTSVLQNGNWYQVKSKNPGIYKLDARFLQQLGINWVGQPSKGLRMFGIPSGMLPEANAAKLTKGMQEMQIWIEDGGDGIFNEQDYYLFYSPGAHKVAYNSITKQLEHQFNLYTDSLSFLICTHAGNTSEVKQQAVQPAATRTTTTGDYYIFHENDALNLLQSGKSWYGEVCSNEVGVGLNRTISLALPNGGLQNAQLSVKMAARDFSNTVANITVGGQAFPLYFPAVTGNILDAYAQDQLLTGYFQQILTSGDVKIAFQPGANSGKAWLDFVALSGRASLELPTSGQFEFWDKATSSTEYRVKASEATMMWDISNPLQPLQLNTTNTGGITSARVSQDNNYHFVAFEPGKALTPIAIGAVANRNLLQLSPQYLIVTHPGFVQAAERLASFRSPEWSTAVVTTTEIYNEMAAGNPDPSAIRDYIRYLAQRDLRFVLFLGDASYDYKNRVKANTNFVPSWQSAASLDPLNAYVSDDFFGYLEAGEDVNNPAQVNTLDVSIGRLPVQTVAEANAVVAKIMQYNTNSTFGDWRKRMVFVADDEDNNLHVNDAEKLASQVAQSTFPFDIKKIYLDAYPQTQTGGVARYPQAREAIDQNLFKGALVLNYTGHGSFSRLADENVLDEMSVENWQNENKLPFVIAATCDVAPFDNPAVFSLGEKLLLRSKGGAIAVMATVRPVYANANYEMNADYLQQVFSIEGLTLGEAARFAKNKTYAYNRNVVNNRKFHLLGDPAMRLAFPQLGIATDSLSADTVHALGQYRVKGTVITPAGQKARDFNGKVMMRVMDKPNWQQTRANDQSSLVLKYPVNDQILFKGESEVRNGEFQFTFIMPKDINYTLGNGSIDYYAYSKTEDAAGAFHQLQIGDKIANTPSADTSGPQISAWLNTKFFRQNDITSSDPLLLIDLFDEHGINTTGKNIGHDITAWLDDSTRYFVLNDYFNATLNSYQRGSIEFPIQGIAAGAHELTIKAWDTYNNSSVYRLRFRVPGQQTLQVESVVNFPNPFNEQTRFIFTHNQGSGELAVSVQIFNTAGQSVRNIKNTINVQNERFQSILWDGKADSGVKVNPGIYFYKLTIRDKESSVKHLGGKLLVL
ncbi:type IX secretion system sortase PorU [Chitinophaga skermanii]|nr:type IX secretion system sortase PorU [Chitinophaga skermanii]